MKECSLPGGGPGTMEPPKRDAFNTAAPSIGFNIRLETEQLPNPYISPDLALRLGVELLVEESGIGNRESGATRLGA